MYNPYGANGQSSNTNMYSNMNNPNLIHPQATSAQSNPQYNTKRASGGSYTQPQPPTNATPNNPVFNMFLNDPKANLGFQMGQTAFNQGTQMMENNLKPYIGSTSDLKNLFKVSNRYVVSKISLILFPFRDRSWSRLILNTGNHDSSGMINQGGPRGSSESFELPVNDVNSPDLYIPLMAFVTYILLVAIFQGLKGEFHPEMFGYTFTKVFGYQLLDILVLKLGLYLLNVDSTFWDLISYSNYKFIPLVLALTLNTFLRGNHPMIYWLLFGYLDFAFAFFLMRSLRQVFLGNVIDNGAQTVTAKQRQKRINMLFGYSYPFQMVLMWLLM